MPSFPSNPFGRPGFEAQATFLAELTRRSADVARHIGELNLQLTQQILGDVAEFTRQAMACPDPFQAMTLSMRASHGALERVQDYQQRLASLFTGTQAPPARAAQHQQRAAMPAHASVSGGDPLSNASRADNPATAAGHTRVH